MELQLVTDVIYSRLEENDGEYLEATNQILYCEGWVCKDQEGKIDTEFADNHVISLKKPFEIHVGLDCGALELLDEWHNLIEFTRECLYPVTRVHSDMETNSSLSRLLQGLIVVSVGV